MVLIAAGVLMQRRRGEILHDCATEADINDLHAFTDPENGKPVTDAQLKRLQLQDVKLCVNGTGAVKAGVMSPPPGRISASQPVISPMFRVTTGSRPAAATYRT